MSDPSSSNKQQQQQQGLQLNPRGIPHAPFVSNVQEHLGGPDEDVEPTLRKFQETMSKYKFMEMNTAQRRGGLEDKIPDIRKTLQMVEFLKQKKDDPEPISTTFELNDTLYAKAELDQIDKVHIWLGANVMLSYPLDEAIQLLTTKLEAAETSLSSAKEDLDFLREQITIMEVNIARVHNWDVKRRREKREALEQRGLGGTAEGKAATAKASTWLYGDRDPDERIPSGEAATAPDVTGPDRSTAAAVQPAAPLAPAPASNQATAPPASAASTDPATRTTASSSTSASTAAPPTPAPVASSHPPSSDPTPAPPRPSKQAAPPDPLPALALAPSVTHATTIVPPLNFSMISPGVYRSGHPNERNFGFLKRLNLRSIMYLANEEYRPNVTTWAQRENIRIFHFHVQMNKEPLAEMDHHAVSSALTEILRPSNLPILIHCNKGKYRVGCVAGLLRRIQGWSHTSIFEEYARFAGSRIADLEFVEVFDLGEVRRLA